jgi:hypothetical protein
VGWFTFYQQRIRTEAASVGAETPLTLTACENTSVAVLPRQVGSGSGVVTGVVRPGQPGEQHVPQATFQMAVGARRGKVPGHLTRVRRSGRSQPASGVAPTGRAAGAWRWRPGVGAEGEGHTGVVENGTIHVNWLGAACELDP